MSRTKYHHPVPIAETEQEWREIEHLIVDHIAVICEGNPARATALVNLLFVLTDDDFDPVDRGMAADSAVRAAFGFSDISLRSLKNHLATLRTPKGKLLEVKAVSA